MKLFTKYILHKTKNPQYPPPSIGARPLTWGILISTLCALLLVFTLPATHSILKITILEAINLAMFFGLYIALAGARNILTVDIEENIVISAMPSIILALLAIFSLSWWMGVSFMMVFCIVGFLLIQTDYHIWISLPLISLLVAAVTKELFSRVFPGILNPSAANIITSINTIFWTYIAQQVIINRLEILYKKFRKHKKHLDNPEKIERLYEWF